MSSLMSLLSSSAAGLYQALFLKRAPNRGCSRHHNMRDFRCEFESYV